MKQPTSNIGITSVETVSEGLPPDRGEALLRMLRHAQFYGTNEEASPVFFGDASSKKFGTYFVKDGKVSQTLQEEGCPPLVKIMQNTIKDAQGLPRRGISVRAQLSSSQATCMLHNVYNLSLLLCLASCLLSSQVTFVFCC